MYRKIQRNPLGVRKLDVQAIRRTRRREHKAEAEATFEVWFGTMGWRREPLPLTREEVIRCLECQMDRTWNEGVHDGAKATRGRIAEALAKGTLVKP